VRDFRLFVAGILLMLGHSSGRHWLVLVFMFWIIAAMCSA